MNAISRVVAALLPERIHSILKSSYRALRARARLGSALRYDKSRFTSRSGMLGFGNRAIHAAGIIKTYHRIEKGLALAAPRPGFGVPAVRQLLDELDSYLEHYGPDQVSRSALNTLGEYQRFNQCAGAVIEPDIDAGIARLLVRQGDVALDCIEGGTRAVERAEVHAAARMDLRPFFGSRFSVRQFADEPVDMALIERAIRMAQKTPSVCNREAGRVAVIRGKPLQARAFALQNGNRGFGEQADKLLIVAADLSCFLNVGERYQAWIDGGMFAMSLVYALHSLGLGSCCLNWSVEPEADRALRRELGLPGEWAVIMMIAVGHLPEHLAVAQSPRRPFAEIMRVLD
jgi:nitroreductase